MSPRALLFDCDNTLVLSEDIAFEGCALLVNEILEKNDISDRYNGPGLLKDFVGQNFRGMMVSLQKKYNITLTEETMANYVDRELATVTELLKQKAEPCPGVVPILSELAKEPYILAVVSSSALPRVVASLHKTSIDQYFGDRVYSAATSLPKPTSKPDPAVYLHACEKLGVSPSECVAFEDSRSGATAAKNAGIPLIGYVGAYETKEEQDKMKKVLTEDCGAIVVMNHWNEFPQALEQVSKSVASAASDKVERSRY
ncbi:HAD-like protein [Cylindrobasidium torrendii FP15055 ss-10]|uniref:HAD-like protein n=1 Tax=Cylindrobasidium torrendii FP15055 ss-10 TaxID=1314674 RepID=A0A0D7BGF1_9AGAR|nr:HAD-like protein [Cylindrobasidium torrendii FP15055 ss-10]